MMDQSTQQTDYGTTSLPLLSSHGNTNEEDFKRWSSESQRRRNSRRRWSTIQNHTIEHEQVNDSWRILDRNAQFCQSQGKWNIKRANRSSGLYRADLFHTIMDLSMVYIVLIFCATYLSCVLIFAPLYWLVSDSCGLEIHSFRAAYYLSLETIMTIGYGLPDSMKDQPYFQECDSALILITIESLLGVICDAICVGLVFSRLGRAQTRATTIVFSDYACIRRIQGRLHLSFQICEMRKHQLIEAHVRCYAISRDNGVFKTQVLRLSKPDDELGGCLLLNIPNVVVHDIDVWSPLISQKLKRTITLPQQKTYDPSTKYHFPDPLQREIDLLNGSREATKQFNSTQFKPIDMEEHRSQINSIKQDMLSQKLEIVVLVEGIDPILSATLQARHSYTINDIRFDHDFEPCVFENKQEGATIDFLKFHHTIPVPHDVAHVHTVVSE